MNRGPGAAKRGRLNFVRVGLPFFAIVAGGAYLLQHFQRVRFDFRRVKQVDDNLDNLKSDLEKGGLKLREGVTVDTVLKEVNQLDTDNWSNIRGPREGEDDSEYRRIQRAQKEKNAAERQQRRVASPTAAL